jgi:hypothetical protein
LQENLDGEIISEEDKNELISIIEAHLIDLGQEDLETK